MGWSEWEIMPGFEDLKEMICERKYRDRGGGVARISFNRPKRMNALTNTGWNEIIKCLEHINNQKDIGVVVFTGVGDHFGVGGDVSWEASGEEGEVWAGIAGDFDAAVLECSKPVVAAVKGYCIGGHNHLANDCDFTIAADSAIMGQNGPRIGSPMGGHGVTNSAFSMGMKRAKEMWMLCRRYTAQEAYRMGMVNTVVPLDKLDEEVDRWCDELLDLLPSCLAIVKDSFNAVDAAIFDRSFESMSKLSDDFGEQMSEAQMAFFEKRKPNFWKKE